MDGLLASVQVMKCTCTSNHITKFCVIIAHCYNVLTIIATCYYSYWKGQEQRDAVS